MSDRKENETESTAAGKRSRAPEDWSRAGNGPESEIMELDRILGGISFPASKESLAAHLAVEAFSRGGGRAAELHDLVVQLDGQRFSSLDGLHQAIRDRHAWEQSHPA